MQWQIPPNEREYLRGLAKKQAEYAALPVMEARRRMWYDLNDGRPGARPPVVIETWTFDRDFMPESVFRCTSETGREIEQQLLRNVRNHELIDDDKVIPDYFSFDWHWDIDEFGVTIERDEIEDSQGIKTGFRYHHPIKNLKEDLHVLKPAVCTVDRQRTAEWKAFLEDLFAGVLKVEHHPRLAWLAMLTNRVVALMGMEAYFMAMYDAPEELHRLMAYLRDNAIRVQKWQEAEGLLVPNNANQDSFGSSYNFTTKLPSPDYRGGPARLEDMWGCANSQETVGVSPAMFHEFCFPYYRDAAASFGLLYYGCCEPTHPFWEDLKRLPHLKKISISRWCDERFMGEALRGTQIVYSRKPHPNFLSVDEKLDEHAWAAHIRETLEAAKGCFIEFIVRDVYTVHGNLDNPRKAVTIARREIDRHYRD